MESGGERSEVTASGDIRIRRKHAKQQKNHEKKTKKDEEILSDLRKPEVAQSDRGVLDKLSNGASEKPTEQSPEDIRTRRKHAKQQKKQEKKTKKEEEFLRDLRKPKSTKVVLADRSVLEKLSNVRNEKPTEQSPEFSALDFPELSPSKPLRKPKRSTTPMTYKTAVNANPPLTQIEERSAWENSPRVENSTVPEGAVPKKPPLSAPAPTPTLKDKKTKKSDPIVLNLGDLIVTNPPEKGRKRVITPGAKLRRLLETNTLCGNMLDSSNPKRSRGKHRETEKRTFTKLKLAIIRDRILSLKAREDKSWVDDMDREKFKLELDMYLSDLMKKLKLAKAERATKLKKTEESTEIVPEVEIAVPEPVKKGKSRKPTKYRKYCDNKFLEDLDKAVHTLIQGIVYLQDRAFVRNPIKAKAKPRHVIGLREVKKCLMLHKVKMLIIAPDLEAQETVFKAIEELKNSAYMLNIPCVFALSRRHLGYASKKSVPVSAFGVLSYDGLEDKFAAVKEKLKEAQDLMKASQDMTEVPCGESNIPL